jgi:hypothetical protein
MEIKTCKRCGEPWCFHGTGRPIRCGKCKSPYWDRERVNGEAVRGVPRSTGGTSRPGANGASDKENMPGVSLGQTYRRPAEDPGTGPETGGDAGAVEMCPYTEYDPEDGETYRCGLAKHGPKVKHTRGRKV